MNYIFTAGLKYGLSAAVALCCLNISAVGTEVKKPTAKAVIQIWLAGGLSQLDSFDPKPNAGQDYCGPYNKPIQTNIEGIQISQMLPLLAKQADKYVILRGMTHNNNGHETAAYLVQTGRKPVEGLIFPGVSAVVSYFKGYNGGYTGMLPPSIIITSPLGRFSETGFLGSRYKSFATGSDPMKQPLAVEFGQRLPRQLQTTAREHFLCGRVMREIATDHRKTLHQVRKEIDLSRSLLVMMLAGQQEVPTELAARTLLGRVA